MAKQSLARAKLCFAIPNNFNIMQYSTKHEHRPLHIYTSNQIYFITGRTYVKSLLNSSERKREFYKILLKVLNYYNLPIYGFCILDDHYHLLISLIQNVLKEFAQKLHSESAIFFNNLDQTHGRKCFYQYWDYCIRDKKDFFLHFNYIHNNPIKHDYCRNFDGLSGYKFCSYKQWFDKKGEDWMAECLREYPVKDFSISIDD